MDAAVLLRALERRAPWQLVARPLLKRLGLAVSTGFDDTIAEIVHAGITKAQFQALRDALVELHVAGEKRVQLYKINRKQEETIRVWAEKRRAAAALSSSFPSYIGLDDLRDIAKGTTTQFVKAEDLAAGLAVVYTAPRHYLERIPISVNVLSAAGSGNFEKAFGIRRHFVQTFDVIWIPAKGNYVAICVDHPKNAPKDFSGAGVIALELELRRALGEVPEPVNLWDAIDGLYRDDDGRFVELGFGTDADSAKHHKARRGTKCLREDVYHKHGAAAVEDLQPYRASVAWKVAHDSGVHSQPEVQLPGLARDYFQGNSVLDYAMVRHCLNVRDLEFVISKLLAYGT